MLRCLVLDQPCLLSIPCKRQSKRIKKRNNHKKKKNVANASESAFCGFGCVPSFMFL